MFKTSCKNIDYNFKFDYKTTKKNKIKKMETNELIDVIIIGAGATGISAANYLQQHGKKVMILEARNRIGGRINDEHIKGFGKIPLGAAWLHYKQNCWKNYKNHKHMLKDLLNEHDVKYVKSSGLDNKNNIIMYDHLGKKFTDEKSLDILKELPSLICKESKKYPNMILSVCIRNILKKYNLPKDIENAFINRSTEHCSLNADKMLCKNYDCWQPNGDIVVDGYSKLIKKLSKHIKIKLNSEVIEIDQSETNVKITTKQNHYRAKYVICTIPLGVLKTNKIMFIPSLPEEKINSLKKIDTGLHEKIFLSFPYKFWDLTKHVFHYADKNNRGACTQWQTLPIKTSKNIIYTNLSGPDVNYVYKTDKQLQKICMRNLKKIFGKQIPEPLNIHVTKWKTDPYTMGSAHCQPNLEGSNKDFKIIRKPFNKLFFTDVSEEVTETVEAAILTGVHTAKEIICKK